MSQIESCSERNHHPAHHLKNCQNQVLIGNGHLPTISFLWEQVLSYSESESFCEQRWRWESIYYRDTRTWRRRRRRWPPVLLLLRQRSSFRLRCWVEGIHKKLSSCFPLISSVIKLIHFHRHHVVVHPSIRFPLTHSQSLPLLAYVLSWWRTTDRRAHELFTIPNLTLFYITNFYLAPSTAHTHTHTQTHTHVTDPPHCSLEFSAFLVFTSQWKWTQLLGAWVLCEVIFGQNHHSFCVKQ